MYSDDIDFELLRDRIMHCCPDMDIAVDFDGTLCKSAFPNIGKANTELIELLITARYLGHRVILWTCRENEPEHPYLTEAVEMCRAYGLEFDSVNENVAHCEKYGFDPKRVRKIYADIYIDDKAFKLKY